MNTLSRPFTASAARLAASTARLAALALAAFTLTACVPQPEDWLLENPVVVEEEVRNLPPAAASRSLERDWRLNRDGFLQVRRDGVWTTLAGSGWPTRVLWPDFQPEARPATGFSLDEGGQVAAVTPLGLYLSSDSGATWLTSTRREQFGKYAFLTAVALEPGEAPGLLIGTSFHGLHETRDGGRTWVELSEAFKALSPGNTYHETLTALAYSRALPRRAYAAAGISGKLYLVDLDRKTSQDLGAPPGVTAPDQIKALLVTRLPDLPPAASGANTASGTTPAAGTPVEDVEVRTLERYWRWNSATRAWTDLGPVEAPPAPDAARVARLAKSADKYGLYVSSFQAADPRLFDGHLNMMAQRGLNAVVVDFKEDFGLVTYDSQVPLARASGAVRRRLNVPEIVKKVHERGFYLIARVVVFKDKNLYPYNNHAYATWDTRTNRPWGQLHEVKNEETGAVTYEQREFWVDTYSREVWDYNIGIARELESLGVDEIQFDYIRFPSDGPVDRIRYRHATEGMSRMDALESFLRKARAEITIPVSIDIFGFNGWYLMDYLGQNAELLSHYVDAISPMSYPSHYPRSFLGSQDYLTRARTIFAEGNDRTWLMTQGRSHIRTWVQAFLLGGELNFDTPTYTRYLTQQLDGAKNSRGNGWLLWNASNRYYMVTTDLSPYTRSAP